jgi:cytochrome c peroxidase
MMFKVPGLRNIAKTAPYYHNGKLATLNEAISLMAEHQTGRTLTPAQVDSIVIFLDALTGDAPAAYISQPELPPSTAKTPKPDTSD